MKRKADTVDAIFTDDEPRERIILDSVAYHEAGHVVALYQTGGRLGYGGVRIGIDHLTKRLDTDGVTCIHDVQCGDDVIVARVAEAIYDSEIGGFRSLVGYGEIKLYLRQLRINRQLRISHHKESGDDHLNTAKAILKLHPRSISDPDAIRLVHRYERETIKLIGQHWASVERVAKALERRRRLSHSAVVRCLMRGI